MRMKRTLKGISILAVLLLGVIIVFSILLNNMNQNLDQLQSYTYEDFNLTGIDDGVYHGTFERFPIVVEVDVTIVNETVTSIVIVRHQNGQGAPAESIVAPVIEAQSLDVAVVAGATYSSYAILLAIQDAIEDARGAL